MQVQRRSGRIVNLGHHPGAPVAQRHCQYRPAWREEGEHRVGVQVVLRVDVAEKEPLTDERAGQLGADQMTDGAVRAVSADHPWRRDVLYRAVGVTDGDLDRLAML